MNRLTYRDIPRKVVSEMAKHLDSNADANWEALADRHGFKLVDITVRSLVLLLLLGLYQIFYSVRIVGRIMYLY